MTWKDVSVFFKPCWTEQWGLNASATVKNQLGVYENSIKGSKMSFLSKYTLSTTTAWRKSAASNDKAIHVIKTTSKRVGRVDAGKPRKYIEQETFVINLVGERWNLRDPLGKIELKDEVMSRDDCLDGTDFYKQYLNPTKLSAASGWTNWVSRVLTRGGRSLREYSISQTVPKDWRTKAEAKNAARIQKRFKDEKVDVAVNAD